MSNVNLATENMKLSLYEKAKKSSMADWCSVPVDNI